MVIPCKCSSFMLSGMSHQEILFTTCIWSLLLFNSHLYNCLVQKLQCNLTARQLISRHPCTCMCRKNRNEKPTFLPNQMCDHLKPIATFSHKFSIAWGQLHLYILHFYWFIRLSVSFCDWLVREITLVLLFQHSIENCSMLTSKQAHTSIALHIYR